MCKRKSVPKSHYSTFLPARLVSSRRQTGAARTLPGESGSNARLCLTADGLAKIPAILQAHTLQDLSQG